MTHALIQRLAPSALCLALACGGAAADPEFQLESALVDSVTAQSLGASREKGSIATFFAAQKAMVYDILRSSGIDLARLPPDVRGRLEKFHTTNLAAFKAFSTGLDLKDQGKFAEAKAYFEKAIQLDPNFKLAEEQKVAMPNVNLVNLLQIRAAVTDAAKTAVSSGQNLVAIDLAHAMAAMLAGQTVVIAPQPTNAATNTSTPFSYSTNPPGSGDNLASHLAIGTAFSYTPTGSPASISIATTNEYTSSQYARSGTMLESITGSGDFAAQHGAASDCCSGTAALSDGTPAYWGTWRSVPGASAAVALSGSSLSAPVLGSDFNYLYAAATQGMPSTGTAVFTPVGGFLTNVSGNISINFVTRSVNVNNLGFDLSGLMFSQLNGSTTYSASSVSGFFAGNYSSGTCTGCAAFSPAASSFTGNFVGSGASGIVFSSIMQNGAGTVAGVHLFGR
ncbi:MAG: tetratricopeptide repeat protein [Paucibacter sp.]|nr:tetratricopeptide repeat protein [Roseateles sp.]